MREADEEDAKWAAEVAQRGATLFHVNRGVVGKVTACARKQPEESNLRAMRDKLGYHPDGPLVFTIEPGHEFHALRDNFVELTGNEITLWQVLVQAYSHVTAEIATLARSSGVARESFTRLAAAVLRDQYRALQKVDP